MLEALKMLRPDEGPNTCNDTPGIDYIPEENDTSLDYWIKYYTEHGLPDGIDPYLLKFDQLFLECKFIFTEYDCKELFIGFLSMMGRCYTFNYARQPNVNKYSTIWYHGNKPRKVKLHHFTHTKDNAN